MTSTSWGGDGPITRGQKLTAELSGAVDDENICDPIATALSTSTWGEIRDRRKGDREWEHDLGKKRPRWGFPDGCMPATELSDDFLDTSVKHLLK